MLLKSLQFKEAKRILYGYIAKQANQGRSFHDGLFSTLRFCPTCEKILEEFQSNFEACSANASAAYLILVHEMRQHYLCRTCNQIFFTTQTLHLPVQEYAYALGYKGDPGHGYSLP